MSCLKGESGKTKKTAKFTCEKCGAATKKKGSVCKPVKLDGEGAPEKPEKKEKKAKKKKK